MGHWLGWARRPLSLADPDGAVDHSWPCLIVQCQLADRAEEGKANAASILDVAFNAPLRLAKA
jgi:hypothetical protein